MRKKEKKKRKKKWPRGMDFHFGRKRFGAASVGHGRRGKTARPRVGNESESMCVLFNVTADTVQKDGIMCEWRNIREASGERGGSGRGLSAGTKHLFKHWTFLCNFTRSISIVDVDVAVVGNEKKKREGLHIQ